MTGLLRPSGTLRIFGETYKESKRKILSRLGFVPQDFAFYMELDVSANLEFFGSLYGLTSEKIRSRSTGLMKIFGLDAVAGKPAHQLSGGMKRRLNLIIGLLHEPQILFLDEPTVGVDVHTRQLIIRFLKDLNSAGTTLVYTSHQLDEAQELCDEVALIDAGKILAKGALRDLLTSHNSKDLEGLFLSLTVQTFNGGHE
jgi:ABC-2 type transport system ATP-binding protein